MDEKELTKIVKETKFADLALGEEKKVALNCELLAKKMREEAWYPMVRLLKEKNLLLKI